jgi:urease accessory protein
MQLRPIGVLLGGASGLASGPALAHHAMGGETPTTAIQGLLAGLAHPVIGPDHLACVVGIGILSAFVPRGWLLAAIFLGFGAVGTAIHLGNVDVPAAEILVGMTVLRMAGAVWFRRQVPFALLGVLCGLGGLAHGYALAESIAGAEPSPLGFYLAGLAVVQLAISLLVREAVLRLTRRNPVVANRSAFAASAAMLLVGIVQLSA